MDAYDADRGPAGQPMVPPPGPPARRERVPGTTGDWVKALAAGIIGALLVLLLVPALFGVNPYDLVRGKVSKTETHEEVSLPRQVTTIVSPSGGTADVSSIAKAVSPGIVNVRVQLSGGRGIGSGMIYRQDGYIITNNHVTSGASNITVTLASGEDVPAEEIGSDEENDLSVIKINKSNLPAVALGDSSTLVVGQLVVALGSPLGFEQTVTSGIISALHRNVAEQDENGVTTSVLTNLIQTDAPINPGNSGGALTDSNGRVVGINTLIASQSGGSQGIGFAIPINAVKPVAEALIAGRPVIHPYLGATGQTVDGTVAQQYGFPVSQGAYLTSIDPDSPAAKAGLKPGFIVVSADGRAVRTMDDFYGYVHQHNPGDKIQVVYYDGNQKKTTTLTVGDRPPKAQSQ